ncbi:hypothetical protein [Pseudomonas viridiflava]|uniref:hypothetical protein n=1 Tax=Pseudomonas viridiflava TaxID=33069 RepID=UPI000F041652|nr:hypothetical protein [Pseudomonas viridiflava]
MIAIRKTKESPEFSDVYLTESKAFFSPGFEPRFTKNMTGFQLKNLVSVNRSQALTSKNDGKGLFRVFFNFGAKWSAPESADQDVDPPNEPTSPQLESVVTIECEIVAEFTLDKPYDQAELDDFALSNAIEFVIPYWKNYLISQCGLMRLHELVLPNNDDHA